MRKNLFILLLFLTVRSFAESGVYLTADTGSAIQVGMPSKSGTNATRVETDWLFPAGRFGIGYNHDFNPLFGVELEVGLGWYGKTTYYYSNGATTQVRAETSEYLLAANYHPNCKYDIFLKLGGIRLAPIVTGWNAPHQETKIASESALGTTYYFTRNCGISLTYVYVPSRNPSTIEDFRIKTQGLSELLVGFKYLFAL